VRNLLPLLVAGVVMGAAGCGGVGPVGGDDRFTQSGTSMEPTVKAGQVITVRSVGHDYTPRHGDIVVFHPGGGQWGDTSAPFLKRVIAVGGETVACCDPAGRVTVNGAPLAEPYIADDAPVDMPPSAHTCGSRRFGPVAVATGSVFVMGDNRANSNDSRCAGPIPASSVFAVMIS
jgi:signal peptidase I